MAPHGKRHGCYFIYTTEVTKRNKIIKLNKEEGILAVNWDATSSKIKHTQLHTKSGTHWTLSTAQEVTKRENNCKLNQESCCDMERYFFKNRSHTAIRKKRLYPSLHLHHGT